MSEKKRVKVTEISMTFPQPKEGAAFDVELPKVCCYCLAPAEHAIPVRIGGIAFEIPYCDKHKAINDQVGRDPGRPAPPKQPKPKEQYRPSITTLAVSIGCVAVLGIALWSSLGALSLVIGLAAAALLLLAARAAWRNRLAMAELGIAPGDVLVSMAHDYNAGDSAFKAGSEAYQQVSARSVNLGMGVRTSGFGRSVFSFTNPEYAKLFQEQFSTTEEAD